MKTRRPKRIIAVALTLLLFGSMALPAFAAEGMYMYALDGRCEWVAYSQVAAWQKVGWYTEPVMLMYALDGRCEVVAKSQAPAWQSVGWYTEPVMLMYALDGRCEVVAKSQAPAWQKVGWYTEPVVLMYAADGRCEVVGQSQVAAWQKVGWYTQPVPAGTTPTYDGYYPGYYGVPDFGAYTGLTPDYDFGGDYYYPLWKVNSVPEWKMDWYFDALEKEGYYVLDSDGGEGWEWIELQSDSRYYGIVILINCDDELPGYWNVWIYDPYRD